MGGSLFNVDRLPNAAFQELSTEVITILHKELLDVRFSMVPYYRKKKDFGDMDIVVESNADKIIAMVERVFDPEQMNVNDGIVSFSYKNFQIDLICTLNHFDSSLAYYSYNDIGNLLGRLYHKLGLKFGHEGLLYPLRDKRGGIRQEIVVSKDIRKILEFLGLDYSKWANGFDTMEEIFRFVCSSQYFDRGAYEGELSAINKKRDKKRKTFNSFLMWLEIAQPESKYSFLGRDQRDTYIEGIDAYFGCSIRYQQAELEKILEKEDRFKEKFSGDLLMMLTPLKGADLGRFLGMYKKHILKKEGDITKDDNEAFEDAILAMDQDKINKSIMEFYDGLK